MLIGGVQKTTLLDYPNKVACIIFTVGCNFRCGFCHNPDLINSDSNVEIVTESDFFEFLESRKNILDGVVISGGEPMLQKYLKELIIKLKNRGLLVKLDTNGTFPDRLKELIDLKLIDYVAMDIKTLPEKYKNVVDVDVKKENILKSINILLENKVDYEFRTTVVEDLHSKEDLINIAKLIKGAPKYFLQKFIASQKLLDKSFGEKKSLKVKELDDVADIAKRYVGVCDVR